MKLQSLKMVTQVIPASDDVVCHIFKIRVGSEFYSVTVCGSRYKAELYMKHEMQADDIEWIKSFVMQEDIALRYGKKNRIICREGFVMRVQFLHNFGTIRSKRLADKVEREDSIVRKRNECVQ